MDLHLECTEQPGESNVKKKKMNCTLFPGVLSHSQIKEKAIARTQTIQGEEERS